MTLCATASDRCGPKSRLPVLGPNARAVHRSVTLAGPQTITGTVEWCSRFRVVEPRTALFSTFSATVAHHDELRAGGVLQQCGRRSGRLHETRRVDVGVSLVAPVDHLRQLSPLGGLQRVPADQKRNGDRGRRGAAWTMPGLRRASPRTGRRTRRRRQAPPPRNAFRRPQRRPR